MDIPAETLMLLQKAWHSTYSLSSKICFFFPCSAETQLFWVLSGVGSLKSFSSVKTCSYQICFYWTSQHYSRMDHTLLFVSFTQLLPLHLLEALQVQIHIGFSIHRRLGISVKSAISLFLLCVPDWISWLKIN